MPDVGSRRLLGRHARNHRRANGARCDAAVGCGRAGGPPHPPHLGAVVHGNQCSGAAAMRGSLRVPVPSTSIWLLALKTVISNGALRVSLPSSRCSVPPTIGFPAYGGYSWPHRQDHGWAKIRWETKVRRTRRKPAGRMTFLCYSASVLARSVRNAANTVSSRRTASHKAGSPVTRGVIRSGSRLVA